MIPVDQALKEQKEILFITGLSGSGKTACIQVLLDFGYLILSTAEDENYFEMFENIIQNTTSNKIAFISSIISAENFQKSESNIEAIEEKYPEYDYKRIFITANIDVLINRYQETRKMHPFNYYNNLDLTLEESVKKEVEITMGFRQNSDLVINTSTLAVEDTKGLIKNFLEHKETFVINIYSFGFKHGRLGNADFLFDLRSLPNPFYIENLRKKTGLDKKVRDYVFSDPNAELLYQKIKDIVLITAPGYKRVGKAVIDIGIGCTGGQHRSVSFVERLAKELAVEIPIDFKINSKHIQKGEWKC